MVPTRLLNICSVTIGSSAKREEELQVVDEAHVMREPSFQDALKVLLLQAADEGRGEALFGESLARATSESAPFIVGEEFPNVYLEFPLSGSPFLDVTLLYSHLKPGTRVDHPAAAGTDATATRSPNRSSPR